MARPKRTAAAAAQTGAAQNRTAEVKKAAEVKSCLLYTSDAADEL